MTTRALTFCLLLVGGIAYAIVPPAEWDVNQAPENIQPDSRIAPPDEPGDPLVISGTVYGPDGNSPLAGVVVYAYHTDIHGVYRPDRRLDAPPRLRGWARTDAAGHYSFRTIRCASYPSRNVPAHVHFHLWGPSVPRQFVDGFRFGDDPLVTPEERNQSARRGKFATICLPERSANGIQQCTFNIQVQPRSNFP